MASISSQIVSCGKFDGIFPGWGSSRIIVLNCNTVGELAVIADTNQPGVEIKKDNVEMLPPVKRKGLTPFFSVAIAGNDLMGSCLYTAGVCTVNAGKVCFEAEV